MDPQQQDRKTWKLYVTERNKKRSGKRDLHFLDVNGMVACNPRGCEAAHRAEVEGIATENPQAVTCKKCRTAIKKKRD